MSLLNQIKPKQNNNSLKTARNEYAPKGKAKSSAPALAKVSIESPINTGFMMGIGFQLSILFVSLILVPVAFCAFFVLGVMGVALQ